MKSELEERPSVMARRAVQEMIELQRRIFEKQRLIIESNETHPTRGFNRYRDEYRLAVTGYTSESGFGALCDAIGRAQIAYIADYHTLALAQSTFVKLIGGIMHQVDNICLAMEFINKDYQDDLNRYLKRKIQEKTFLKRIQYSQQWPYDIWPNFRPIFKLAMDRGFPVIAIDSDWEKTLKQRDKVAARQIAKAAAAFPGATILVFCGQMHLAPSHLPAEVDNAFVREGMSTPDRVIVFQNAEEIYWQLAKDGREGVEVVQVDPESYCVNNTPPLVQQLSYLHWIHYDHELLEYTELESTVKSLISHLGGFFDLPFQKATSEVRVLMPGDLDLMDTLAGSGLEEDEIEQILASVEAEESACLPGLKMIYLATLSVNHAAEEAAHYLRAAVSGASVPEDMKDRFYFYVLDEALAFFSTKVINPKRKTDHPGKLRQIVAKARKKGGKRGSDALAAAFSLDHLALERGSHPKKNLWAELVNPVVFNAAAHMLGYILGDRLYYGLTSGLVAKKVIRDVFVSPHDQPGEALDTYLTLRDAVKSVKIPRRI